MAVLWFLKLVERGGLQAQPTTKFLACGLLFSTGEPPPIIPHSSVLEMEEVNSTNFEIQKKFTKTAASMIFSYLRDRELNKANHWSEKNELVAPAG